MTTLVRGLAPALCLLTAACGQQPPAPPATPAAGPQPALPSWQTLPRLPLPATLPDHPRVFCTAADLQRVRADLAAGDAYTAAVAGTLRREAAAALAQPLESPADVQSVRRARALAQAQALLGDERYGRAARERLLAVAARYPTLETTRARGRLTDSTLHEGPVAIDAAWAYDLLAGTPLLTAADRTAIRDRLLRPMALECGHRCTHTNSSNWRTWALAIVASCGFAAGDRALIDEAINGVWDPERKTYLYGVVQQLTHSFFSDGIHWERSAGYTYYTASALLPIFVAAQHSGIDLWHAPLPGLLGPFEGSAPHDEYGPAGNRSPRALLDALFYLAFPGGTIDAIGDSGTRELAYHPIFELAWREYQDPKYAWLLRRARERGARSVAGWSVWQASGQPLGEVTPGAGRSGAAGRLRTVPGDRVAFVQDVAIPGDQAVTVTAHVKAVALTGATAHLRGNFGDQAAFSAKVSQPGDWQALTLQVPAGDRPAERSLRLHLFLEGGAGEVLWDDVAARTAAGTALLVTGGDFEGQALDGRGVDFWNLIHAAWDVPAGAYDLAQDATIGLSGRHQNGATLFPIGGFAVLRADPGDPEAPGAILEYGPYGSGHDHPDRLHVGLFGLGTMLSGDPGSWGYENPDHVTWARQTIAHNTITADEVSQEPARGSTSLWPGERRDQPVFGVLRQFHPGRAFQLARATCDTAYPGSLLDRTIVVTRRYLLDVVRLTADRERTWDLPWHGLGTLTSTPAPPALAANPWTALGYRHFSQIRRGPVSGLVQATFQAGDRRLSLWQVAPRGRELILAAEPRRGAPAGAVLIARQQGRTARFVTVLEPSRHAPTVRGVDVSGDADLTVTVTHAAGTDRLLLPAAYQTPARFSGPVDGQPVEETAQPLAP